MPLLRRTLIAAAALAAACSTTVVDEVTPPSSKSNTPNDAVAGIRILGDTLFVPIGARFGVGVTPVNAAGQPSLASLAGPIALRTADPSIARIDVDGTLLGVRAGRTTLHASVPGFADSATVVVSASTPEPTRTGLRIYGASTLRVGTIAWITAMYFDASGRPLSLRGKSGGWTADDPKIVRLDPTPANDSAFTVGVTGLTAGRTTLRATIDGHTDSLPVTIVAETAPTDSSRTPSAPVAQFDLTTLVYGGVSRTPTPSDTTPTVVANAAVVVYVLDPTATPNDTLGTRVRVASGTTDATGSARFPALAGDRYYVVTVTPPASSPYLPAEFAFGPPRNSDYRAGVVLARKP